MQLNLVICSVPFFGPTWEEFQGYYNFHIKKIHKMSTTHKKNFCLPSRIKVKHLNAKTFLKVVAAFSNSILKSPFEL